MGELVSPPTEARNYQREIATLRVSQAQRVAEAIGEGTRINPAVELRTGPNGDFQAIYNPLETSDAQPSPSEPVVLFAGCIIGGKGLTGSRVCEGLDTAVYYAQTFRKNVRFSIDPVTGHMMHEEVTRPQPVVPTAVAKPETTLPEVSGHWIPNTTINDAKNPTTTSTTGVAKESKPKKAGTQKSEVSPELEAKRRRRADNIRSVKSQWVNGTWFDENGVPRTSESKNKNNAGNGKRRQR